jgi:hypothetical protein
MLFSLLPIPLVFSTIRPGESAIAVFLVILVLPFVDASVDPISNTVAAHLVVLPLTLVFLVVMPYVYSFIGKRLPFP